MRVASRLITLALLPFILACNLVTSWLAEGRTVPTPSETPGTPAALASADTATPRTTPPATLVATPASLLDFEQQAVALRRPFQDDLEGLPAIPHYSLDIDVDLNLEDQTAVIDGWARILYTHLEDEPLDDLVLMLWPNESQYHASMTAGPVAIMGTTVEPAVELGGLALRLRLPRRLASGERVDLSLPFRVEIDGPMLASAPARMAITQDVLLAPTFYPLIPRRVDGEWQIRRPAPGGDTTNSDVAAYQIRVTSSADYSLAISGASLESASVAGNLRTETFVTGPVRDVALALGPLRLHERQVDGITLRAWVLPAHEADVRRLLNAAETQLRVLGEMIGAYPYTELDLVDAPDAYGGIEYPGLVFIGTLGTTYLIAPVVHEVGHQWFYGLVGSDQLLEPWLDEAAASYTEVLYYEEAIGPERGTTALAEFREVVESFSRNPQAPIGWPLEAYPSEAEYSVIVYAKGALFFDALRRTIGDRAFFEFLHSYFETYRYGFADGQGFERLAEAACACDLDALFDLWVHEGGPLPSP